MKATRVKILEKYWMIDSDLKPVHLIDDGTLWSNGNYENGNYFNTKEEAEAMADKIRKVLNGANVIELPSDEEISESINNFRREMDLDEDETPNSVLYNIGFRNAIKWLKFKL